MRPRALGAILFTATFFAAADWCIGLSVGRGRTRDSDRGRVGRESLSDGNRGRGASSRSTSGQQSPSESGPFPSDEPVQREGARAFNREGERTPDEGQVVFVASVRTPEAVLKMNFVNCDGHRAEDHRRPQRAEQSGRCQRTTDRLAQCGRQCLLLRRMQSERRHHLLCPFKPRTVEAPRELLKTVA